MSEASSTRLETPIREALEGAVDALAAAAVDDPRLDAELLLAEAMGTDRAMLAADRERGVTASVGRAFGAMVRRRIQREPVAYIVGRKGFRNIEVAVDRRVLIPRPETEVLVEVAIELGPQSVLDVGTGSGAVALAIADELPSAAVVATDASDDALAVARENSARLGFADRVRIIAGTLPEWRFELLVANLPYVSEGEWETLEPEIREFEPRDALVAGPTGLEETERLVAALEAASQRPTAIALEVGADQAAAVAELVRRAGYAKAESRPDLAGIERVVIGRR
jgi:release factor glutamine methyltransferase